MAFQLELLDRQPHHNAKKIMDQENGEVCVEKEGKTENGDLDEVEDPLSPRSAGFWNEVDKEERERELR